VQGHNIVIRLQQDHLRSESTKMIMSQNIYTGVPHVTFQGFNGFLFMRLQG